MTVKPGEPITWVNKGSRVHTVTFVDGIGFGSGPIQPGGRYTLSLQRPGTYRYRSTATGDRMRAAVVAEGAERRHASAPPVTTEATITAPTKSTPVGTTQAAETTPAAETVASPPVGATSATESSGTDWSRIAMFVAVGLVLAVAVVGVAIVAAVLLFVARRGGIGRERGRENGPRY